MTSSLSSVLLTARYSSLRERTAVTWAALGGSLYQTMLKECYAAGDVRAFPDHCGGLAGEFLGHSLAEDCYFKGTLTSDGRNTGGIVGYIRNAGSTVNRCCCQAAVSGRMNTGGIGGLCGLGSGNIMEYSLVLAPSISGLTPTRRVMGDMSTALTLRENYSTTTQLLKTRCQSLWRMIRTARTEVRLLRTRLLQ